jgi:DeoR family transcriptional regulator of aga operon
MNSPKLLLRRQSVLTFIYENGEISLDQVCKAFNLSEVTARRDLRVLQEENRIWKIKGNIYSGIKPPSSNMDDYFAKNQFIAQMVVDSLANNNIVFLGPEQINDVIANVLLSKKHGLTIITSNIRHVAILRNQEIHEVFLVGGKIDLKTGIIYGPYTENVINAMISDVAIFGCKSIDIDKGVFFNSDLETQILSKILNYCHSLCIIADHTQFSDEGSGPIFPLKKIEVIFTDTKLDREIVRKIREKGIEVIQAEII